MGPLAGLKVVELAGIGPVPFCSTLLADMGAEVLRIDRTAPSGLGISGHDTRYDLLNRGRRSISVDLKNPDGVATVLRLVEQADALVEGFRPGVAERLGLGPDVCLERNPALVYGRMTGWGQDGPVAHAAGHDINYISLSGVLYSIGTRDSGPVPPLNLTGDFGGGAMFLAFGVMAGLWEAQRSGKGQVVDTSMVEGSAYLMMGIFGMHGSGFWTDERGANILDTGSPYYGVYETKDGKWISIGSIEPKFYAELLEKSGMDQMDLPEQHDREKWPQMIATFREVFKGKTRDEWCEIMEGSDICFAPVLSMTEAPHHPQNVARESFIEIAGVP
ncbi:MAG: CaiB/BaiF CoA-transferase family protein, partial [Alphaproteobacteria bacterium]|nr:CaiB/BaiF CoA-transferase family protein [Alphaproteobacteria bacterium]